MYRSRERITEDLDWLCIRERAEFAKYDMLAGGPGSNHGWQATEWARNERRELIKELKQCRNK